MTKKVKIIVFSIACVTIAGFTTLNYVLHGGGRDLQTEEAAFSIDSKSIIQEFNSNPDSATKKYLNKAIEIKGTVSDINAKVITIDAVVSCQFQENPAVEKGKIVTVKGRITGFDDLLGELKMDQCFITK